MLVLPAELSLDPDLSPLQLVISTVQLIAIVPESISLLLLTLDFLQNLRSIAIIIVNLSELSNVCVDAEYLVHVLIQLRLSLLHHLLV